MSLQKNFTSTYSFLYNIYVYRYTDAIKYSYTVYCTEYSYFTVIQCALCTLHSYFFMLIVCWKCHDKNSSFEIFLQYIYNLCVYTIAFSNKDKNCYPLKKYVHFIFIEIKLYIITEQKLE